MFDFDVGKLLLIGVVALIFIPPKDLPNALRTLGKLLGQARRMATDFQSQFNEALREAELTQIRNELHDLKNKASVESAFDRMADMLEAPAAKPAPTEAAAETHLPETHLPETHGSETPAVEALPPAPAQPGLEIVETPAPEPAPVFEPLPLPEVSRLGPGKSP